MPKFHHPVPVFYWKLEPKKAKPSKSAAVVAVIGEEGETAVGGDSSTVAEEVSAPPKEDVAEETAEVLEETKNEPVAEQVEAVEQEVSADEGQTESSFCNSSTEGATEIVMPQMGESITEGTVSKWLKEVGDTIEKDEPLLEISTDKVDAEVPSPAAGKLLAINVNEGETVEVGAVVG